MGNSRCRGRRGRGSRLSGPTNKDALEKLKSSPTSFTHPAVAQDKLISYQDQMTGGYITTTTRKQKAISPPPDERRLHHHHHHHQMTEGYITTTTTTTR
ncbi:hypothetical protein Hamer_G011406 [Homarus americanus]|uniref:Uncharacterized protein n=1 Tax=Homarus americanus TaxID=6706 RepID=A0A8J5MPD1_HOMAM|nr:hypothetical protein Hamer_G011406 [Homarus americanus]